jgi:hypothetical protein
VSTSSGEVALRLIDFEEDKGKLEELYRTYMTLKAKSPEQAELLREQRLLAIAMNKSKTDVRLIEPDFLKKYMSAVVPAAPPLGDGGGATIPGLDIAVEGPSDDLRAAKELTNQILRARVVDRHKDDLEASAVTEAGEKLATVASALDKALDQAGRSARLTKKRLAAADRISDATEDINLALDAVVGALQTNNFEAEDIDEPLRDLSAALRKLARSATRNVDGDESGEGVAWLKAVASLDRVD